MNRPLVSSLFFALLLGIVCIVGGIVFFTESAFEFTAASFETSEEKKSLLVELSLLSDSALQERIASTETGTYFIISDSGRVDSQDCNSASPIIYSDFPNKAASFLTLARQKTISAQIGLISNILPNCLAVSPEYKTKVYDATALLIRQSTERGLIFSQSFRGFLVPLPIDLYSTDPKATAAIKSYFSAITQSSDVKNNSIAIWAYSTIPNKENIPPFNDFLFRMKEFIKDTQISGLTISNSENLTQDQKKELLQTFGRNIVLL